ncbi:MAG: hypothetical protein CVU56_02910 [Deltaproteobacteria bacterium HGW-Deltaproteobacteria-14]|nr:MAG: hypothetical protein CVU56_02910 [Deltaproteobacteria bacterium HGW-Deltaproteobacteria-14]
MTRRTLFDALSNAVLGRAPRHPLPPANAPRFRAEAGLPHVESWFVRANAPDAPRALWLKATILAPRGGGASADAWAIAFDGEAGRTYATRLMIPLSEADFRSSDGAASAVVGPCRFTFGDEGAASGALVDPRDGAATWDLAWRPLAGPLGAPLVLFPHAGMLTRSFPRSKLLTPVAAASFSGALEVFGERWDLTGWRGMQGHNWGREHAPEYAWGHVLFADAGGEAECVAEGFSARIRLARRLSPRLSALVVRRGDEVYRFDRTLDFWRQRASIDDLAWTLRLASPDGVAELAMAATPEAMVCLGYRNPDGTLAYCYNSKLAGAALTVTPRAGAPFRCESAHGGAFELLTRTPDPRFPRVV